MAVILCVVLPSIRVPNPDKQWTSRRSSSTQRPWKLNLTPMERPLLRFSEPNHWTPYTTTITTHSCYRYVSPRNQDCILYFLFCCASPGDERGYSVTRPRLFVASVFQNSTCPPCTGSRPKKRETKSGVEPHTIALTGGLLLFGCWIQSSHSVPVSCCRNIPCRCAALHANQPHTVYPTFRVRLMLSHSQIVWKGGCPHIYWVAYFLLTSWTTCRECWGWWGPENIRNRKDDDMRQFQRHNWSAWGMPHMHAGALQATSWLAEWMTELLHRRSTSGWIVEGEYITKRLLGLH